MANYKVNEKSKTISVSGELTPIEKNIIATYIASGYKVREKKDAVNRIKYADIEVYLKNNKKEDVLKEFDEEQKKEIVDKNGKKRKGGYLVALKWFKKEHADIYAEIKKAKEEKNK